MKSEKLLFIITIMAVKSSKVYTLFIDYNALPNFTLFCNVTVMLANLGNATVSLQLKN